VRHEEGEAKTADFTEAVIAGIFAGRCTATPRDLTRQRAFI